MKKYNICGILMIIVALFFFSLAVFTGFDTEEEKEVKCYDRYGNEILDQVCFQEEREVMESEAMLFTILSTVSFVGAGIFFSIGSDI